MLHALFRWFLSAAVSKTMRILLILCKFLVCAISPELCDRMRFLPDYAKSHHRILSEALNMRANFIWVREILWTNESCQYTNKPSIGKEKKAQPMLHRVYKIFFKYNVNIKLIENDTADIPGFSSVIHVWHLSFWQRAVRLKCQLLLAFPQSSIVQSHFSVDILGNIFVDTLMQVIWS